MTWNSLKRLSICAALLTILASSARAATDTVSFRYGGLVVRHGQVLATKPDGLMTRAEFAAEITVLSDGRLVGGFGLWELGTPDILSLYRMVEVDSHTGPFFTFKAQRLSPSPASGITITLRRLANPGLGSDGSVTFFIDGVPASDGQPLSFTVEGEWISDCVGGKGCHGTLPEFAYINSPAETVVAQGITGPYTATFENVALVFSSDLAIGRFTLSSPTGAPQNAHIVSGHVQVQNGEAINAWLRGQPTSSESKQPLPVLMVIANQDFFEAEPCRIYDILGTQSPVRLEAHTMITRFTLEPR